MSQLLSKTIDIAQHDDVYEFMFDHGITDGLPLVPPTRERVERMLSGANRLPSEVICKIPPNYAPATVEKIAINAVAAGARPEYLPVIIAAVEAAAGGRFPLHGTIASTDGIAPMLIVNGPIREQIGMNWGLNALGQGNRANMTIGRALRLVLRNVGGAREGEIDQTVQGGAHKFTLTFAEHEDASPWPPLHVEHGYDRSDSVVTLLPV
ncbi:MAG: TlpA family protein disulfide reductase, partial [Chloroflexi bacterium]|nr:TlpA family protein disulfide reductase [Chloroflexota bacterium]